MYFPSRRERRAFAKKLGLRKKDETYTQWLERTRRSQEAGKQIHFQRIQDSYNEQLSKTQDSENIEVTQAAEEINFSSTIPLETINTLTGENSVSPESNVSE